MAGLCRDNEKERFIDRIKAAAWKEARDCGAGFITRKWVANRLNRTERWVTMNWNKLPDELDCKKISAALAEALGGVQL